MKKSRFCIIWVILLLLIIRLSISAFPYDNSYPYGFSSLAIDQAADNNFLLQEWEEWKRTRITENGARGFKRVQRSAEDNYDTVSEGMAYGLLFSVYFNEQELFDDLYSYVKLYLNNNGLMSWHIDANGNVVGTGGYGSATDADEDIALALIFAHKVWGSSPKFNYEEEARTFLTNLYNHCVEPGTYVLKPGDSWGGSNVTNPSYFAPAWYKIFADFSGNSDWLKVADKCYEIIEKVKNHNGGTGLVPDWCTAEGRQAQGQGYDFTYDAIRYPWRTAIDYSWFGDERARNNCNLINAFFKNIGAGNIVDGYSITGNVIGSYHNAAFVSMVAASSMTGYDLDFARELYAENKKVKDSGDFYSYYGNCLRLFALLYTTGNFPNLYSNGDDDIIPGDIDGNGTVNSIDYVLLRRYILGIISDFPTDKGFQAADLNRDTLVNSLDYSLLRRTLTQ